MAYGEHERARRVPEPGKRAQPAGSAAVPRTDFERDRARVLHSVGAAPARREDPGGATAGAADFPRTRLTHSLEVAQIARELGAALGCDPDVVDAAGLAHDLGHPPFGHNGEDALDEVAQAVRRLRGQRPDAADADPAGGEGPRPGRRARPGSTSPGPRSTRPRSTRGPAAPASRKYGVYADDRPVFDWLRAGAPDGRRCLEAQVMDWADDVAYSVHDVEDGIHAGHVRLADAAPTPTSGPRSARDVAAAYSGGDRRPTSATVLADLLADCRRCAAVAGYDGTPRRAGRAQAGHQPADRPLRAAAVGRDPGRARRRPAASATHADLVVPRRVAAECALLKAVAARYVMRRRGGEPRCSAGSARCCTELVAALADRAPDALDPVLRPDWLAAADDAARLRVVVDQVAALTDPSAPAWHARLTAR